MRAADANESPAHSSSLCTSGRSHTAARGLWARARALLFFARLSCALLGSRLRAGSCSPRCAGDRLRERAKMRERKEREREREDGAGRDRARSRGRGALCAAGVGVHVSQVMLLRSVVVLLFPLRDPRMSKRTTARQEGREREHSSTWDIKRALLTTSPYSPSAREVDKGRGRSAIRARRAGREKILNTIMKREIIAS